MAGVVDDELPRIRDLFDKQVVAATAARSDAVGRFLTQMLQAADPNTAFESGARASTKNQGQDTRRLCVTALAKATGANRAALKAWLRAKSIVGEMD
jgi:hypothetical protein